jgi:hypothetical protein
MPRSTAMKQIKPEERGTIMVRGVPLKKWKIVRELAESRGLKLKYAIDEMFDDWIGKHETK